MNLESNWISLVTVVSNEKKYTLRTRLLGIYTPTAGHVDTIHSSYFTQAQNLRLPNFYWFPPPLHRYSSQ